MPGNQFWDAATMVLEWLDERGYSISVRCSHRRCYRLIGEHLDSTGLEPSAEAMRSWLAEASPTLPDSARKAYGTAVSRLAFALERGAVPDSPLTHRGPSLYDRLPKWATAAVDDYIGAIARELSESSLDYERVCASHFMGFACDLGVGTPRDLTSDVVISYGALGCQSASTRARRLSAARGILGRMCSRGEVPPFVVMLADDRYGKWAACYEPIPGVALGGGGVEAEALPRMTDEFVAALEDAGYARSPVKAARKALGLLYVFLSLNGLPYTRDVAASWAERAAGIGGGQGKAWRRATLLFGSWLTDRTLRPEVVFRAWDDPADGLPEWASAQLRAYLTLREREGCARSTLDTCRSACVRFLAFASVTGASHVGDIDAVTVSRFCAHDATAHSTAAAAALYVSKVRSFLEWLSDEGQVRHGLALAANASAAPRTRVVRVLDDTQLETVRGAIASAETPMELRDAAMVALGLEMGLRASDVVRIALSDIAWRSSSLTVTQRKTGVTVTLPLTVGAGNAIVAYLRWGRPTCDAAELFVSHRAPRRALGASACRKAIRNILGEGEATFHQLRRTFATGMLRAGSSRLEVSEALGHTSERSATPYLSLDPERLRRCAMSPSELGIGGGGRG